MDTDHARLLIFATALVCSAGMGLPISGFPNLQAINVQDELGQRYLQPSKTLPRHWSRYQFHPTTFAVTVSAPPSPPPPPSPASPSSFSRPIALPPRFQHHAVFDLESSSPLSFTGAEKTTLKAQLDRARQMKILIRDGKPARPLTREEQVRLALEEKGEGEWSTTSSGSRAKGEGGRSAAASGTEEGSDWVTDDEKAKDAVEDPATSSSDPQVEARTTSSPIEVRGAAGAPLPSGCVLSAPCSASPPTIFPTPSAASSPCRTAAPSPSRSPTSRLTTLLSRGNLESTADPVAVFSPPPSTPSGNPFGSRQTTNPGGTWNGQPLAAALAAEKTPLPVPATAAPTHYPPPPSFTPAGRKKVLAKTKSLPSAPPPSPASSAGSSLRTASNESSSPPRPPIPRLPPSSSFPLATPNRFFSGSRLSSPNVSPPLPPLPSSSIMGVRDPKDLTLHFARRPDMSRKGSMGESFQRFMRGPPVASDGRRRRKSLGPQGTDADVESTDTEVEELEERSGFDSFEPSVFASPRSNSAASLSSASSSIIRSRSGSGTPSGSAASSVQSSPKLMTTSLSSVFSLPSPILPSPPLPPAVTAAPDPSRAVPPRVPPSGVPLQRTKQQGVNLKQLRQQQQARRLQLQAEVGESSSSSSSPSATDVEEAPVQPPSSPRPEMGDRFSRSRSGERRDDQGRRGGPIPDIKPAPAGG
ncbi:hypothetical protein JCM6882_003436 [Rhodosporidiobolus microsporus]